jgi:hypothetical protein
VYLGNNQFLYTDPDAEVDCEALAGLLNAIRQTLPDAQSKATD